MLTIKNSILGILSLLLWSCQTTSYVAKVDSQRKKATIESQSDLGSPIYSLQKKGALDATKRNLKERLKKDSRHVKSLINLSQIYLAQGKIDASETLCKQALKYDLNNKNAKLVLAQIYFRKGYSDMAEIILNSLGKNIEKDSVALNLKALIALENDRPSLGMFFFKQALKFNPGDVATRMNLGVLFVYYRQVDAASIQFERVLKVMPDHVDAKLHLAVVKASKGQGGVAEDLYKEVLSVDPGNALATYNLAVLEEKRKNLDDSLDYVRKYLGTSYAKSQNNKEVFAMIERLRAKKDMMGETLSDSEITEFAAQLNTPSEDVRSEEDTDSFLSPQKVSKPVKAVEKSGDLKEDVKTKSPVKYDDDDIDSLEKALLE